MKTATLADWDLALIEESLGVLAAHHPEKLAGCIRVCAKLGFSESKRRLENVDKWYRDHQLELLGERDGCI